MRDDHQRSGHDDDCDQVSGKIARMVNRRTFIGASVATAVAVSRASLAMKTSHQIDRIGLQLYTVRDAMKADFEGTIARVAASGYK